MREESGCALKALFSESCKIRYDLQARAIRRYTVLACRDDEHERDHRQKRSEEQAQSIGSLLNRVEAETHDRAHLQS